MNKIKVMNTDITVQGIRVSIKIINKEDFISITDMIRAKDGNFFISDWLRNGTP